MKLSVVIPFYKELPLISRAVESVLANSDSVDSLEVLICNDGPFSEQEIRKHLTGIANEVTIVLENRYASGPGGARNTGLDASTGECIAFLDADDVWLTGKVSAQLSVIQSGASFVPTGYGFDKRQAVVQPPVSIDQEIDIFIRRGIGTSTVMITRALLADRRFKDIRFAQDIDFWYNLACSPLFKYFPVRMCFVEYSTGGSTKNKFVQFWYLYKVLRINKVPLFSRIQVLFSYFWTGIHNHYIRRLFA